MNKLMTNFVGLMLTAMLLGQPAFADTVDPIGVIAHVTVFGAGSEVYNTQQHGEMLVDRGGGDTQLYRWGGARCGGEKDLTPSEVEGLLKYVGNKRYRVQPSYLVGLGSTKCLVAYTITTKKYAKLLTP